MDGSTSEECDSTGQCTCKKGFVGSKCKECDTGFSGEKCDSCDSGFFNYPDCKGLFTWISINDFQYWVVLLNFV